MCICYLHFSFCELSRLFNNFAKFNWFLQFLFIVYHRFMYVGNIFLNLSFTYFVYGIFRWTELLKDIHNNQMWWFPLWLLENPTLFWNQVNIHCFPSVCFILVFTFNLLIPLWNLFRCVLKKIFFFLTSSKTYFQDHFGGISKEQMPFQNKDFYLYCPGFPVCKLGIIISTSSFAHQASSYMQDKHF